MKNKIIIFLMGFFTGKFYKKVNNSSYKENYEKELVNSMFILWSPFIGLILFFIPLFVWGIFSGNLEFFINDFKYILDPYWFTFSFVLYGSLLGFYISINDKINTKRTFTLMSVFLLVLLVINFYFKSQIQGNGKIYITINKGRECIDGIKKEYNEKKEKRIKKIINNFKNDKNYDKKITNNLSYKGYINFEKENNFFLKNNKGLYVCKKGNKSNKCINNKKIKLNESEFFYYRIFNDLSENYLTFTYRVNCINRNGVTGDKISGISNFARNKSRKYIDAYYNVVYKYKNYEGLIRCYQKGFSTKKDLNKCLDEKKELFNKQEKLEEFYTKDFNQNIRITISKLDTDIFSLLIEANNKTKQNLYIDERFNYISLITRFNMILLDAKKNNFLSDIEYLKKELLIFKKENFQKKISEENFKKISNKLSLKNKEISEKITKRNNLINN